MTIAKIDFAELYRQHMRRGNRAPKPASAWDARAADMSRKAVHSNYADDFIKRMDLRGAGTLLDVGCGHGTVCLPLAAGMQRVYGLDYSQKMLDRLMANAKARGLDNVVPLRCAWEDDWSQVPVCDIAIASRSTAVDDIAQAIAKLNAHARKRVYMTHLAGGSFADQRIATLLGRHRQTVPDYIYVVNILHALGIHPRLDYIETPSRLAGAKDFAAFAEKVAWSFGALETSELDTLRTWYEDDPQRACKGDPMRWAFMSWEPGP